jgi:hypothetical protein
MRMGLQIGGWAASAVLMTLGVSAARAQSTWVELDADALADAAWEDRLEPLAHELAGTVEPAFELQLGASPTQRGFALQLRGGEPLGWALLSFEGPHGPSARQLVRLDEHGAARVLRRDWRAVKPVRAKCVLQRKGGGRARLGLTIPESSSFPTPPLALTSASSLVITEIMKDPTAVSDSAGEWFEVRNVTSQPVDITGWLLTDGGSNNHVIASTNGPVVVPSRSYFVLGINANATTNGGIAVDYKYSSFTLGNGADSVQLFNPSGVLVDAVSYDDGIFWPDTPGKSLSLDRALVDVLSNDDGLHWCDALAPVHASGTDCATPRRANTVCP